MEESLSPISPQQGIKLDSFNPKLTPEQEEVIKKEADKREEIINTAIEMFQSEQAEAGNIISFKTEAAKNVTDNYYAIIYVYFKDFVSDRIESSKVSSAMEMAVVMSNPIENSTVYTAEQINAIFAYQLGAIFSISLKEWDIAKMEFPNNAVERQFINIVIDHRIMLEGLISHRPISTFPLASNAQFWKLLEFIFGFKEFISPYNH
ncbi:MAG: hypothetical protein SFW35_04835 [Chitinophagales bacterium]|nr:hypothetical protein [Chitinophagales bacterium]